MPEFSDKTQGDDLTASEYNKVVHMASSGLIKPGPRMPFYDDFDRADGALGTAPSGQAWTGRGADSMGIESGAATATSGIGSRDALSTVPVTPKQTNSRASFHLISDLSNGAGAPGCGLVPLLDDASNYVYVKIATTTETLKIVKVVGGTETTITTAGNKAPGARHGTLRVGLGKKVGGGDQIYLYGAWHGEQIATSWNPGDGSDLDTLFTDTVGAGMMANNVAFFHNLRIIDNDI